MPLLQSYRVSDTYPERKGSDTLESFLSKVVCHENFAIFLLSKETFTIRTCSILQSFFRKLLSKENFLVCH